MSRIPIHFSISLVAFLIGLGASSILGPSQLQAAPKPNIPTTWKRFNLDYFSFYGPDDLKDLNSEGIDSSVWHFRNQRMTLAFDYGMYSNDLADSADEPQYREKWFRVDGRAAKVATFRMNERSSADGLEKERPYITAVYFPAVKRGGVKLSVWAYCVDSNTQEEAKKVFFSLKFK